jgi:hypothetical protein
MVRKLASDSNAHACEYVVFMTGFLEKEEKAL